MPKKVIGDDEFITLVERLNHIGFLVASSRQNKLAFRKYEERLRDIIQLIYKKFNSKSKIKSTTQNNSFLISTKKIIANKIKIIDTKKTILKTIKFYKKI